MTRRQYFVALIVLAASGLAGGALSSWLMPGRAVWAQKQCAEKEVRADRFVLVDEARTERAVMATSLPGHAGPGLWFFDGTAKTGAVLGVVEARSLPRTWN